MDLLTTLRRNAETASVCVPTAAAHEVHKNTPVGQTLVARKPPGMPVEKYAEFLEMTADQPDTRHPVCPGN